MLTYCCYVACMRCPVNILFTILCVPCTIPCSRTAQTNYSGYASCMGRYRQWTGFQHPQLNRSSSWACINGVEREGAGTSRDPLQVISSRDRQRERKHNRVRESESPKPAPRSLPRSTPRSNMECWIGSWNACSISNKSASIQEHIASENLDIFCVVETSHESSFSPSLIASTPPGYKFLEQARPLPAQSSFHAWTSWRWRLRHLPGTRSMPQQKTLVRIRHLNTSPHLYLYFNFKDTQIILVVIYRPGSKQICNTFFAEFNELLASLSKYSCHLIIVGDINIHLDNTEDTNTKKRQILMTQSNLTQLVNEATHQHGHTLDVIITNSNSLIGNIHIWENLLSCHRTSSLLQLWHNYIRFGRSKNWNLWPVLFARWSKQMRERSVRLIRFDHETPPIRACPKTKSENSKAENLLMVRRQ